MGISLYHAQFTKLHCGVILTVSLDLSLLYVAESRADRALKSILGEREPFQFIPRRVLWTEPLFLAFI